jgi:hypothetical protein
LGWITDDQLFGLLPDEFSEFHTTRSVAGASATDVAAATS